LLVVVAIIAILAALLLPALARARDKARDVFCLNNEKQGFLSYRTAIDNETGLLPLRAKDWYRHEFANKSHSIWICPWAPAKPSPTGLTPGTIETAWHWYGTDDAPLETVDHVASYAVNAGLLGTISTDWRDDGTPFANDFCTEDQITHPTLTPVLADGVFAIVYARATEFPATNLFTGDTSATVIWLNMKIMNIPRHGKRPRPVLRNWPITSPLPGAVNVSFFDGHAQPVKLDGLWQLYWTVDFVPPPKRPGLK
jgi:prepilin-type processing-associated H-X9-DG protein